MKITFREFWRRLWKMANESDNKLDCLPVRTLWKTASAHSKGREYREIKIGKEVFCLSTACEGSKDIDQVIQNLAVKNAEKNP